MKALAVHSGQGVIPIAVDEQARRRGTGDVRDRAGVCHECRKIDFAALEQPRPRGSVERGRRKQPEVGQRVPRHHGGNTRVRQSRHQRQVATGRLTPGAYPRRIDSVLPRAGADEADRSGDIIALRRPARLSE